MAEPRAEESENREKYVDLVFEGGGVKGIALVGAFSVLEERGYEPQNMAGASAGAIVAVLLAAGYTAAELQKIIGELDYDRFKDEAWEDRIPLAGKSLSVLKDLGIYEGKAFLAWMGDLLEAKGVRMFGDLVRRADDEPRYRYKAPGDRLGPYRAAIAGPSPRREEAWRQQPGRPSCGPGGSHEYEHSRLLRAGEVGQPADG